MFLIQTGKTEHMSNTDIIIVGAGASGLIAARRLAEAGNTVIVIEARTRIGGRAHTTFSKTGEVVELGAEFIHGDLPLTQELLNEASIPYHRTAGKFVSNKDGKFEEDELDDDYLPRVMDRLSELKEDMDIRSFLEHEFPGDDNAELRESTIAYVESYEAAEAGNTSSLALYKEWQEEHDTVYRIEGGYGALTDSLYHQCVTAGCRFYFETPVKTISYAKDSVSIQTENGQTFTGRKCIITVPIGILKLEANENGYIRFEPAIDNKLSAAKSIGYGPAIRFLLLFKEPFWEEYEKNLGFVFGEEEVAVWWTQQPTKNNLLVGWTAGPKAAAKKNMSDEDLLQQAVTSLANIFSKSIQEIKDLLEEWTVANWGQDPYSYGAYTYASMDAERYKKILKEPVLDTLYFAGEGVYIGDFIGTVEAALVSGQEVAERILKS